MKYLRHLILFLFGVKVVKRVNISTPINKFPGSLPPFTGPCTEGIDPESCNKVMMYGIWYCNPECRYHKEHQRKQ
jgi:hypothetical protein